MKAASKRILALGTLLEGCSWYACKDELEQNYVPKEGSSRWIDEQTLEVDFIFPLRNPTEVDPRRFALLRYNANIDTGYEDYCFLRVCYQELASFETIPESLDWDPAEPDRLRLHFATPVPAGACDPWRSPRDGKPTDFQALELVYLGPEDQGYYGDTYGEPVADPDELAWADEIPIESFGPEIALQWLELCVPEGLCGLDEFCVPAGSGNSSDDGGPPPPSNRWVDCP